MIYQILQTTGDEQKTIGIILEKKISDLDLAKVAQLSNDTQNTTGQTREVNINSKVGGDNRKLLKGVKEVRILFKLVYDGNRRAEDKVPAIRNENVSAKRKNNRKIQEIY